MRPTTAGEVLSRVKLPAFLCTDLLNIRYLSGLPVSAGLLLFSGRKMTLFVDVRYADMASRAYDSVAVRDIGEIEHVLARIPECGFESNDVSVLRKSNWKRHFPHTKFIQTTGVIDYFRRSKDEAERRHLQRARRITREVLRRVPAVLRKPLSEQELARKLRIWALELGADDLSFDPIVAFGSHTACPHHRPTSRVLKRGHLVQIDVGAKVNGYCADMSEIFFTAPATPLEKKVLECVRRARATGMAACKVGASTRAIDRAARAVLAEEGYEEFFVHALGHGVGLDIHEGPTLSSKAKDMTLLSGEVLAVEPGVYFPGKFGMRLEDMVFVNS